MLAGVPVVTTSAGGIVDVIGSDSTDGPYGYVVTPEKSSQLCSAITNALKNPCMKKLADRAREHALRNFTHHQMIEGTLSAYHEWLADSASRSA